MNSKKRAAEKAVEYIHEGMIVGLGTGSTAFFAIQKLGERVRAGLRIKAVASSKRSEELAKQFGVDLVPIEEIDSIDITIDGADEVDNNNNLIKGGGGALLREKILASHSKRFVVIIDESKLVGKLGRFPVPVEIIPFASNLTLRHLRALDCEPRIRRDADNVYITDNGNIIADCFFEVIEDPERLSARMNSIPGVVENGLFSYTMVHAVIIGKEDDNVTIKK